VTAGDVDILQIGAMLGAAAAVTPFVGSNADERVAFGVATVGMLGGILLAERGWARPYDHSTSDATQLWLGTVAGGLVGGAAVVVMEADDARVATGLVTLGASIGALAAHSLIRPAAARPRRADEDRRGASRRAAHIELAPLNLALAAANVRGVHTLLSLRF
jgi:hypothetical protein